MERFAERYHEENPAVFSCSETAWVLSFGLMILNTDMYNRNIKVSLKKVGGTMGKRLLWRGDLRFWITVAVSLALLALWLTQ